MFRSKFIAAAAVVALAGGAATIGAAASDAATPSCGSNCVNIFPRIYSGTTLNAPQYVLDVLRQGAKVGQPIILFRGSNTDPAEDFKYSVQGTVSDFYGAGLVSAQVALHYGCHRTRRGPVCVAAQDDIAYEIEYEPYGVASGLCVGLAATASQNEGVTLQPCGVSAKSVWIEDANPGDNPIPPYYAGINASDTNFSQPFVLTYPASGFPTDRPRPQVRVANLTGFSANVENDNQLWTGVQEVLP